MVVWNLGEGFELRLSVSVGQDVYDLVLSQTVKLHQFKKFDIRSLSNYCVFPLILLSSFLKIYCTLCGCFLET
jgi:hypothetical protein